MADYIVTEDVLDDGEFVFTSVVDPAGATMLSFPGEAMLNLHVVKMRPRHTVLLPGPCPLAMLTAAVGLPAHQVIEHPVFAQDMPGGSAVVIASCLRGDSIFVEFDRAVTPPPAEGWRRTGRRISVCYHGPGRLSVTVTDRAGAADHATLSRLPQKPYLVAAG